MSSNKQSPHKRSVKQKFTPRTRGRDIPHPYPRSLRVNELLREVLANSIEKFSAYDDKLSLLTVTQVIVNTDMRRAVVFFSSLTPSASKCLQAYRVRLQAEVGKQLKLKYTPHLTFEMDPVIEAGEKVSEILNHLRQPENE